MKPRLMGPGLEGLKRPAEQLSQVASRGLSRYWQRHVLYLREPGFARWIWCTAELSDELFG